jgi:hypothetical protein
VVLSEGRDSFIHKKDSIMQIEIFNAHANALALSGEASLPLSYKPNAKGEYKFGGIDRLIGFGQRQARQDFSAQRLFSWLANGQYRPVTRSLIDVLVPKSAQPFVSSIVPPTGPIKKEMLVSLARAVVAAVEATGKEPKGEKAFYFGVAKEIVRTANADSGNGEVVSEQ